MMQMNVSSVSGAVSGIDMAGAKVMATASLRVLDMAQDVFSQIAGELIDALSAVITGVGGNIDMYV